MSDNLRSRIIRLAAARPDLRSHLLPLIATQGKVAARPLNEIAREIRRDWKPVDYSAKPYLEAMGDLNNIDDKYGEDDGRYIVNYFLSNSGKWRGDVAKRIKAELKQMVGRRAGKEACGWDGGESDTMGCGEGTVMAKFEEGKPADPTENMSPEDAAEWKKQNIINKDQFKTAEGRTMLSRTRTTDPSYRRVAGTVIDHDSIRRTTSEPQVYDTWLLTSRARNGKKPQMAARQVMSQFKTQISQMSAGDAVKFVDDKVMEMTGKYPDWHYYTMPD